MNPNFTSLTPRRSVIISENKYGTLGGTLLHLRRRILSPDGMAFCVTAAVVHVPSERAAKALKEKFDKNLAEFNTAVDDHTNQARFRVYCKRRAEAKGYKVRESYSATFKEPIAKSRRKSRKS